MRYARLVALWALVTLATVSIAVAADRKDTKKQSSESTNSIPATGSTYGENEPGITIQQENAVPYRPCREALGWVNGRLRCSND
jgi:hypothetical protein